MRLLACAESVAELFSFHIPHSTFLEKHSSFLEKHSTFLEEHSTFLEKHSSLLDKSRHSVSSGRISTIGWAGVISKGAMTKPC